VTAKQPDAGGLRGWPVAMDRPFSVDLAHALRCSVAALSRFVFF
jgi:hypothetical protein